MRKPSLCEQAGHCWEYTTAPGWFRCGRIIATVENRSGSRSVPCGVVAHCPGCLGYILAGVSLRFCSVHDAGPIREYPVVSSGPSSSDAGPVYDQPSLF